MVQHLQTSLEHLDYLTCAFGSQMYRAILSQSNLLLRWRTSTLPAWAEDWYGADATASTERAAFSGDEMPARLDLSALAFDANLNLTGFRKLKTLRVNAANLLGGYGPVTSARAHAGYQVHSSWAECNPMNALVLSDILPASLEKLIVWCDTTQFEVLDERLRRILGPLEKDQQMPGFSELKSILIAKLDIDAYSPRYIEVTGYWSRSEGLVTELGERHIDPRTDGLGD